MAGKAHENHQVGMSELAQDAHLLLPTNEPPNKRRPKSTINHTESGQGQASSKPPSSPTSST